MIFQTSPTQLSNNTFQKPPYFRLFKKLLKSQKLLNTSYKEYNLDIRYQNLRDRKRRENYRSILFMIRDEISIIKSYNSNCLS